MREITEKELTKSDQWWHNRELVTARDVDYVSGLIPGGTKAIVGYPSHRPIYPAGRTEPAELISVCLFDGTNREVILLAKDLLWNDER